MFTRPHLFQSKELCIMLKGWITNTPTRPRTPPCQWHQTTEQLRPHLTPSGTACLQTLPVGMLAASVDTPTHQMQFTITPSCCVCVRSFVSISVCLSLPPCINRNSPAESQIFNYQKAAFPSLFLLFHCNYYFSMTQLWWFTTKLVRCNTRIFIDSQAWE